jgi:hypothetical protein
VLEELNQGGNVLGKVGTQYATDRLAPDPPLDHTVVIEHSHTVGRQPDIALESSGTELQRQFECLKGVLGRMGARTSMGKRDRWVEARGETLLH